jgi:hypothetical protein
MGGASSVFVHPNLHVNEKTAQSLYEFEQECIARNLNAKGIYELLNEKYLSLIGSSFEVVQKENQLLICDIDEDGNSIVPSDQNPFSMTMLQKNGKFKSSKSSNLRRKAKTNLLKKDKKSFQPNNFRLTLSPSNRRSIPNLSKNDSLKVGKTFGLISNPNFSQKPSSSSSSSALMTIQQQQDYH